MDVFKFEHYSIFKKETEYCSKSITKSRQAYLSIFINLIIFIVFCCICLLYLGLVVEI